MTLDDREKKWLLEEKYNGVETPEFFADVQKLASGTPLAYLIGNIPFLGAVIDLDSKPLIPRTETEYWVDIVIKKEIKDSSLEILDIFSGSGCVGVGVLHNTKNIHVDFAELKTKHTKQIQKNLAINTLDPSRYDIFESNVFESLPKKHYDIILANPPYISKNKKETVQDSVLHHEDPDALFAENEGLYFIEKLIKESKEYLKPQGKVFAEFDPWQKELLEDICKQNSITNYSFICDQYDKARVFVFQY